MALEASMAGAGAASTPPAREPATSLPALRVHGLHKHYPAARQPVLRGVDLVVPPGASVALLGANGSGKSTLLRCCLRLVEPCRGEVDLLGARVNQLGRDELRALRCRTGFIFQKHNVVARLSALSNVIHGAMARRRSPRLWAQGFADKACREQAMRCLDEVGLADCASRRADRLSGGQSQRVAIARTLMQRPEIVFADEPAASLDPAAGEEVMALFTRLIRAHGMTLIFSSHDLSHARRYADYIVALREGRVVMDGASDAIDAAALSELYDRAAPAGDPA